jgi:hypothetical protein
MDIIKSISQLFSRDKVDFSSPDPTKYRIVTSTNEYHGTIIQQDDFSIKFQSQENKTVKILKSSINQMSVVPGSNDNINPLVKTKSSIIS